MGCMGQMCPIATTDKGGWPATPSSFFLYSHMGELRRRGAPLHLYIWVQRGDFN